MDSQKYIPVGKIERSGLIGMTTAKAGIKKMQFLARKPFMSEEKKNALAAQNDQEIAKLIFKVLGQLKGTAVKLAQMLSMELELIPPEYRKELEKASNNVPPINRALIRKMISTQLGAPPENVFASFESTPFAAASLGQVHRAVSHDGRELAVKVQYPGISESVKSDLEMLKIVLKTSKYTRVINKWADEIKERIEEELDYLKEAENAIWFRENIAMENLIIPEVIPELTTSKVLTMSTVHGLHLNEWLETNPSEDKRNDYGQMLVDLFNHTLFEKGVLHADPNPGNYFFRDDGKLGLIDFGCVKRVTGDFAQSIKETNNLYYDLDTEKLKAFYDTFGFHFNRDFSDEEFRNFLNIWVEWVSRINRTPSFDFSKSDEYMLQGIQLFQQFYGFLENVEGDCAFFMRAQMGLVRLLQKMEARVDMRF